MRVHSVARVEAGGRLAHVASRPPLTLRRVGASDRDACGLCLVGSAAGPLAGDDLELTLDVGADAHAELSATGAAIAQGAGGRRAMRTTLRVGARARLAGRPSPLVVCTGSAVDVRLAVELHADAALDWTETIIRGRTGEAPGAVTLRWDVCRDGRPVLRQSVDLADPESVGWIGMIGHARVMATALVVDPHTAARTVVHSPRAVAARLDEHTSLLTVLGDDAAAVERALAELRILLR